MNGRRGRALLLVVPVLVAVIGLGYLVVVSGRGSDGSGTPKSTWKYASEKERKTFHPVFGVGVNAREVPGSNGTEWEIKSPYAKRVRRLHGHPDDETKAVSGKTSVADRIPQKSKGKEGGLGRLLSAAAAGDDGPDPGKKIGSPGEWRVNDWPGDGLATKDHGEYVCASSGPRLELVYAHPATWDRRDKAFRDRQELVRSMAASLEHASIVHGGPTDLRIRTSCTDGKPKLNVVEFPKNPFGVPYDLGSHWCLAWDLRCDDERDDSWSASELTYSLEEAEMEIRDAGHWDDDVAYMILWDGLTEGGSAWGYVGPGDSTSIETISAMVPVDFNKGRSVLHEYLHNLGAVQTSAPNEWNDRHCSDGTDVMCYGSGDGDEVYEDDVCKDDQPHIVDCNGDDYFNPLPKPGSYLDGGRNTALLGYLEFDGKSRCRGWEGNRLDCDAPGTIIELDEDRDDTVNPGGPAGDPRLDPLPVG